MSNVTDLDEYRTFSREESALCKHIALMSRLSPGTPASPVTALLIGLLSTTTHGGHLRQVKRTCGDLRRFLLGRLIGQIGYYVNLKDLELLVAKIDRAEPEQLHKFARKLVRLLEDENAQ